MGAGEAPRTAQRYQIQMPLRYRVGGEAEWLEGWSENISRTGILFRAAHLVAVNTPVNLSFALPVKMSGESGAGVSCKGVIVRSLPPASIGGSPVLAARILNHHFMRNKMSSTRKQSENRR